MTGLASSLSGAMTGQGVVPSSPGVMGPMQPTDGLFGSAGKFDLDKLMSTGLSLASASASIFGASQAADAQVQQAKQAARAADLSAQESENDARNEEVRGKQESNALLDNMIQTIAAQRLAFAANGVDIGFGTPISTENSTRKLANLQLSVSRQDSQIKAIARRRQAQANLESGANALASGYSTAANTRLTGQIQAFQTTQESRDRSKTRG